jgi:hypothetical protein
LRSLLLENIAYPLVNEFGSSLDRVFVELGGGAGDDLEAAVFVDIDARDRHPRRLQRLDCYGKIALTKVETIAGQA